MANFIAALDLTIANVSVPSIAASLGVSPREGAWVITSYAVAEAITVPLTGWLAMRFGPARALAGAMAIFGITSVFCGMSVSIQTLVIFRVLQGLAGGPLIPLSQTLLLLLFSRKRSGNAMALWAMTSVLGPITGPVLGGQICDHWNWHWIFLINVPIAAISAFFIWRLLAHRDPPPQRNSADAIGLGLMVTWIGAIQLLLDHGNKMDWFGSRFIVGAAIVAAIGFVAFIIWELTEKNPIVNLRVYRHRGYTITVITTCLCFGAFFGSIIIMPLWLQTNMGYTPAWSGLAAAPSGIAMFLFSPLVGWLTDRVGRRAMASCGMLAFAIAMLWRGQFVSNVSFELVMLSQATFGVCMALFAAPAMSLAMSYPKEEEIPSAAGLMAFTRTTSLAFGTAITITAWRNATTHSRQDIVDRFSDANAVDQFSALGLAPDQTVRLLDTIIQGEAVMVATNAAYYIFAGAMVLGALLIWLAPEESRHTSPLAPH